MNYKTAIYTADYLMLMELMEGMEREFPTVEVMIFAPAHFEEEFSGFGEGIFISDLSRISEADILILLSEPIDKDGYIKNFDGSIIDITGYKFSDNGEVFRADEPIRKILKNIAVPPENTSVVIQLPACIFGKDGAEDLMRQTKDIFSFENNDNLVFNNRIAFNLHFNPMNLAGLAVGKTVDDFAEAGGDVSIRLYPLSTVFTADVYADDVFGLKSDEGYVVPSGFFMASEVSEHDKIFVIQRRNGFTFTGDYIRVCISSVLEKLKEVAI
ncbi:MAG: hypothetical protein IJD28_03195 [Deferribacterales bacterium]|nr:hypothetical protein [Deferribacterales bacterium]